MAFRPHPRYADTDATAPRGWATCERCGFIWNLYKLEWQFEWRGLATYNTRSLVCPNCVDTPQRQLGANILPPDPMPLVNARPEQYAMDEEPVSTLMSSDGKYFIATGYQFPGDPYLIVSVAGSPNNGTQITTPIPQAAAFSVFNIDSIGPNTILSSDRLTVYSVNGSPGVPGSVAIGTLSRSTGKWHVEFTLAKPDPLQGSAAGVAQAAVPLDTYLGFDTTSWAYYAAFSHTVHNNINGPAVTASDNVGDVFQVEVDIDAGKLWFGLNGVWQNSGNPATGVNPTYTGVTGPLFPACDVLAFGSFSAWTLNVGASPFFSTPSTGFSAWG